jgi:hypothetical protein
MKYYLFFLIILFPGENLFAQEEPVFNSIVMTKTGDLNNDKVLDSVVVKQDTISEYQPYRLEIYFGRKKGSLELVLRTDKAILPDFPDGKDALRTGNGFWEIEISDHDLLIKHELLRGHFMHKFRYEMGKFNLIEYSYVESDGRGRTYHEDLDFIKNIRRTKVVSYEEDKVLEEKEEKLQLEFKPNLSNHNLLPDGYSGYSK